MDVFELRNRLVDDYRSYVTSFMAIRDSRIKERVETSLAQGRLWPEPRIGLNPAFEPGGWIDDLVGTGTLHDACRHIFRAGKSKNDHLGVPMRLHRHQVDAIQAAAGGGNYVLTTGTGSGKSLAYIVPIVDRILRTGSGRGVRAIIVYPMNALANSQLGELEKYLEYGVPADAKVTYQRYTGQESNEEREAILADPPDILLTNYVMLELILTRERDRRLVEAARGLEFIVFDELHTYRGRQGADVAYLARRVRAACQANDTLQCIGTSATLASGGTFDEQQAEIARVAGLLFGAPVDPQNVIGETLRRATPAIDTTDADVVESLRQRVAASAPPTDYDAFVTDPLSSWIEQEFGIAERDGRLVRVTPRAIKGAVGAAQQLADLTGLDRDEAEAALQSQLMAGFAVEHPETRFKAFAFRLHQFISKGDTVYASLDDEATRHLTLQRQTFVPGHRDKVLLPLSFCRECGQEYYTVKRVGDEETGTEFVPRDLGDRRATDDERPGFLYLSTTEPWPSDPDDLLRRLPDDFVEEHGAGVRPKSSHKRYLPQELFVAGDGRVGAGIQRVWFVPAPFRFCLRCGVSHGARQRSDFSKLATLGSEGRSTATTVLSLAAVRALQHDGTVPPVARKLLSFTDNRQDASLQAGHFNDFVQVGMLRAALYRAVVASGAEGLTHDRLTLAVFDALDLPFTLFAENAEAQFAAKTATEKALRDVIGYRVYLDQQRGWRITAPNLEQCGLLRVDYESLDDVCRADDVWNGTHAALTSAHPEEREQVARVLLDLMRRELAIKVDYLDERFHEQLKQRSSQHLKGVWALDENERLEYASVVVPGARAAGAHRGFTYIGSRGGFGQFLRRVNVFPSYGARLSLADTDEVIAGLLRVLTVGGQVELVRGAGHDDDDRGYQLTAAAMRWAKGDGTAAHDPIRMPNLPEDGRAPNEFFVGFYKGVEQDAATIEAREHTAQVPAEIRMEREKQFRAADLKILYCSPTMELGVDISDLNVVNLRNVPPTPANYAQRSGRAGRSGKPALVFTYCTTGSPHDQFFFNRPALMVAGQVSPPRLDLANEALVRAHVHALWLAAAQVSLGSSLRDVLDLDDAAGTTNLHPWVKAALDDPKPRHAAKLSAERMLAGLATDLEASGWWNDGWLDAILNNVPQSFERACERWRGLYRSARAQFEAQSKIIGSAATTPGDRQAAKRLRAEAEKQLDLLRSDDDTGRLQSDFYSYRYFASEGFLPGYSFPRLPLSAFIPGARRIRDDAEYVTRPRFLAISEFGPRSLVYHEGARFEVNKVILPVAESVNDDGKLALTTSAKRCEQCAYLHPGSSADVCERCGAQLRSPLQALFRMQNVSTRRRDRISSDEEERHREGFEVRTGIRFATRRDRPSVIDGAIEVDGSRIGTLAYGSTATIWRMNVGRRRRRDRDVLGFVLDVERGYWQNESDLADGDDETVSDEAMSPRTQRVVPFVEDDRNCLIFEPAPELALTHVEMAGLTAALKQAIQVNYQLEDTELAAEPLPSENDRRCVLFYEAAEGGAGVLRRLLNEPDALARVARAALDLCHFDADTGDDLGKGPTSEESCEAACYDCLMSYTNQPDHRILDRKAIQPVLLRLRHAKVVVGTNEHVAPLAQSELEKEWLDWIERHGYRPPTRAQHFIEDAGTRPDFVYDDDSVAVYVDGPHHDYPERAVRDAGTNQRMNDLGYTVIRFGHADDWAQIVDTYRWVFGTGAGA